MDRFQKVPRNLNGTILTGATWDYKSLTMLSIFIEGSSGWEPVPSIRLFAWPCVKLFDDMAIKIEIRFRDAQGRDGIRFAASPRRITPAGFRWIARQSEWNVGGAGAGVFSAEGSENCLRNSSRTVMARQHSPGSTMVRTSKYRRPT
jgi:hypothetical protein